MTEAEAQASDQAEGSGSPPSSRPYQILLLITTVIAIVGVLSVWARTQLLDTDEWVDLSTDLLEQPAVQESVSTYLVDQVYADDKVSEGLREALPGDLAGLAEPVAGVIRGPLTETIQRLLASDRFQQLWEQSNRLAHEALVLLLRGEDVAGLSTADGAVAIELRPLVVAAAETIGLSQERIDAIEPDAGRIVILESDELGAAQDLVRLFEFLAWALYVLVTGLYALSVWIAKGQRMTALRHVGYSLIVVGVVIIAARALAVRALVDSLVDEPSGRPAADAVMTIGTGLLRQQGWSAVVYGLLIAGFAALLGGRRFAVGARRLVAPAMNASAGVVAGATALFLLLLVWWSPGRAFSSWTTGLVLVALVIGAVVALRARTLAEFPDARFEDVLRGTVRRA